MTFLLLFPQTAALARTWRTWVTVSRTGSNCSMGMPSRITLASLDRALAQVRIPLNSQPSCVKLEECETRCNYFFLPSALGRSLGASCKDSIGWMFSKLDTNNDLYLAQSELTAINLDKYEVCIRPFFNSCDTYKDGKISMAEWCLCFWRESECLEREPRLN